MVIKYTHACKGSSNCHAKNHLCQIILERDLDRVKKLIKGAEYFCKNCGRAAKSKDNLCNPSKI